MSGYWGRPEDTAAAFTGDGWLRTGDVARTDAEGYAYIVDRVKDMFVSGGENVYPAEVEDAVLSHPAVRECAVVGVPDAVWGEVGHAVVVLEADRRADGPEILRTCGAGWPSTRSRRPSPSPTTCPARPPGRSSNGPCARPTRPPSPEATPPTPGKGSSP